MSDVLEAVVQSLFQGAGAVVLCGLVLVASVAATVYVVRRRALTGPQGSPERSDQLFWDVFLGSCVAVPALLIPALISPWAGLFLSGAGVAAGVAAYRGSARYLAWRNDRRDAQVRASAHQEAQQRHDELIARWRRYELDPACSIDFPALTDVRTPETSAFIKAMRQADELRTAPHQDYPDAVTSLDASLAAAEKAAGIRAEQA
ncbi:hypothetical protein D7Z96_13240 [Pseudarthrobacter phenanthrenivorans]|uniref:Uncharacterized protein n=2 Tax=Pseudarthrobacter phenanthrenivorans TaxID=361575 RepID=A0A3B0FHZ2_PSEPS|nr:hypothetical protein [Pseudarthrobacter phenanthrenivorans]ADX71256.1 hypothetical protein Asphe3_00370 [Pseudarthrobacter phenanthrenivorans Sphe3]RKO22533.1 hypothetical protein D7Z96_13240 [Pseudarthrobacter phenanthrenivorans]